MLKKDDYNRIFCDKNTKVFEKFFPTNEYVFLLLWK